MKTEGIMRKKSYGKILKQYLRVLAKKLKLGQKCDLYLDNNPKHASNFIANYRTTERYGEERAI